MRHQPMTSISPARAAAAGLVAGFTGTAVMTVVQVAVNALTGSRGFEEDENLPAEVGQRIAGGVLLRDVPDDKLRLLGNVVHWSYGSGLGVGLGVAAADRSPDVIRTGLRYGAAVWGVSLIEMPTLRLAPPVWKLPLRDVVPDLVFHLVYGLAAAAGLRAALGSRSAGLGPLDDSAESTGGRT